MTQVTQLRITVDVAVHHGGHVNQRLVQRVVDQWLEGEADLDGTFSNQLDLDEDDDSRGTVVNSRTVEVISEQMLPDEGEDEEPPFERLPGETADEYKGRKLHKLREQMDELRKKLEAQGVDVDALIGKRRGPTDEEIMGYEGEGHVE